MGVTVSAEEKLYVEKVEALHKLESVANDLDEGMLTAIRALPPVTDIHDAPRRMAELLPQIAEYQEQVKKNEDQIRALEKILKDHVAGCSGFMR